MEWIDTHAHLNDERFTDRIEEVLAAAAAVGVHNILIVGIDEQSSSRAVALAQQYHSLFAVVGIQPNSLSEMAPGAIERMEAIAVQARVVAIGETGMDRYWDRAPIALQREFFLKHLRLADRLSLPVVIHCREAEGDVLSVLREFAAERSGSLRGVMHSFTGDLATAQACWELGLHISFAGMATFKANEALRLVAAAVPPNRLLVETDSPYLAPEPVRGRPNQPAHLVHTGARLAAVRGVSVADLARTTTANAIELFRLPGTPALPAIIVQRV